MTKADREAWYLVGGLGLAVAAGIYLKNRPPGAAGPAASTPSTLPAAGASYAPPATNPYVPSNPVVAPPAPPIYAPPAPPPVVTPPTPPVSAAASNAAHVAQVEAARAEQANYFDQYQADIAAKIAAGQLVKGTAEHASQIAYLASRGGVVNQAAELAKLQAAGLA